MLVATAGLTAAALADAGTFLIVLVVLIAIRDRFAPSLRAVLVLAAVAPVAVWSSTVRSIGR